MTTNSTPEARDMLEKHMAEFAPHLGRPSREMLASALNVLQKAISEDPGTATSHSLQMGVAAATSGSIFLMGLTAVFIALIDEHVTLVRERRKT